MNIPFYKQMTDYSCGPASLQMVLEYFGKHVAQKTLGKIMDTSSKDGTNHKALIRAATKNGLYCYVNNESTLHEIKHFLCRDVPVLVHFIDPSGDDGHYAVAAGYKNGELILNDPWNGKGFRLSEMDFMARWHDPKNIYKNWVMAISKEKFSIGKQFLPK
ncbi:MAG: C39 family peptidase [Candidatus Wildermuthbacteria bacterium]|nr:C39 family peptidase [Candidatus Wildermuthbacteria bacterium]